MNTEKGIIHIAVFLLILLIVGAGFYILISLGIIKNPLGGLPFFKNDNVPKISTRTEYKNPFKKETQYVNPFETYKNPFVVSK